MENVLIKRPVNKRRQRSGKVLRTRGIIFLTITLLVVKVYGQPADTTKEEEFSAHAQTTVITQFKPAFKAIYSGQNSLVPEAEDKLSVTSTLFCGAKLWQGANVFFNPEIAGGSGLSNSLGVAASTNGETYRIGSSTPQFELARLFFNQFFSLNKETEYQEGDINKLSGNIPTEYFSFIIGKVSVSDYFDNNKFSHDPRTQFMSWALMSNGAWDYPANTKGYTPSVILEYVTPKYELRYGFSLVPKSANGMIMNWNISKAGSNTLEYTQNYTLDGKNGTFRILSFFTTANMGNYNQSIALNPSAPDITATRKDGRTKYGFGFSADQYISKDVGVFFRASWNDGNNETWMFTEIDRSVSIGISSNGSSWRRQNDNVGLAFVTSGISAPHRNYLKAGGKGFMLGDGNLNYSWENLTELYYSLELLKNIYISGAYQFLVNPGYNKDRGPVNVFSIRVHSII
jgi:high affinity Mn2+ porin